MIFVIEDEFQGAPEPILADKIDYNLCFPNLFQFFVCLFVLKKKQQQLISYELRRSSKYGQAHGSYLCYLGLL